MNSSVFDSLSVLYLVVFSTHGIISSLAFYIHGKYDNGHGVSIMVINLYLQLSTIAFLLCVEVFFIRGLNKINAQSQTSVSSSFRVPDGVNLFQRVGAFVFACGAFVLEGLRVTEYFETPLTGECFGSTRIIETCSRCLLIVTQTYFLIKNHDIALMEHKTIARLGFLHVIATNIAFWASGSIKEAHHGFHSSMQANESCYVSGTSNTTACNLFRKQDTAAENVVPYFYAFSVEYSLACATGFYAIYRRLGRSESENDETNHNEREFKFSNSLRGLILGALLAICTIAATAIYIYHNESDSDEEWTSSYLYLSSNIILNVVTIVALVPAILQIHKLNFVAELQTESMLDVTLLFSTLAGCYILFFARFVAAATVSADVVSEEAEITAILYIVDSLIGIVQITLQTVYIMEVFHRKTCTKDQMEEQPGREWLVFILMCNLCMWLVNTFELGESYSSQDMRHYFGPIAWTVILYLFTPLAIFYRFHSAVVLSDLWSDAFESLKNEEKQDLEMTETDTNDEK